jgi:hypothetical protein
MSLNNLGGDLSNLGRREEALRASAEAVDLYRELASQNRDAFVPDLARALSSYGSRGADGAGVMLVEGGRPRPPSFGLADHEKAGGTFDLQCHGTRSTLPMFWRSWM